MPASQGFGRGGAALAIAGLVLGGLMPTGPAIASEFTLQPGQTAVGRVQDYAIQRGDTLMSIARKFDIGYTELLAANPGVNDPWNPGVGRRLAIPGEFMLPNAPHTGIVINLAERRLYYFPPGGDTVETYPVGIGVEGRTTPVSTTRVVAKEVDPTWYPPPSIRAERPELPAAIGPGPDDPLGKYALRLGWKNYLIHDTNKPDGVGRNVSHGCIRLYPKDIDPLFHEVSVGTPVHIINEDIEAAWSDDVLYVAVFPTKDQTDQLDIGQAMTPAEPPDLVARVTAVAGDRAALVNWSLVKEIGRTRNGIPTPVTAPVSSTEQAVPVSVTEPGDGDPEQ